jgi:hypothetical protein
LKELTGYSWRGTPGNGRRIVVKYINGVMSCIILFLFFWRMKRECAVYNGSIHIQ